MVKNWSKAKTNQKCKKKGTAKNGEVAAGSCRWCVWKMFCIVILYNGNSKKKKIKIGLEKLKKRKIFFLLL